MRNLRLAPIAPRESPRLTAESLLLPQRVAAFSPAEQIVGARCAVRGARWTVRGIAHYEYIASAKMTPIFREAMLLFFEPRRFGAFEPPQSLLKSSEAMLTNTIVFLFGYLFVMYYTRRMVYDTPLHSRARARRWLKSSSPLLSRASEHTRDLTISRLGTIMRHSGPRDRFEI